MNKVAILTQPLHTNFGGTLQAYALQNVLMEIGCEVETINYRKADNTNFRKMLSLLKNFLKKQRENYPFFKVEQLVREKNHSKFIKNNISLSVEINDSEELYNYIKSNNFNNIIIGSDQVWRKSYSPNINDFFFEFIEHDKEICKITYAASFGLNHWEYSTKETEYLKKLICNINNISVRECSAVDLCKKHLNVDVKLVLDPTLLLTKEDYIRNFNLKKIENKKGIFKYILDSNACSEVTLTHVADKLDKKIFSEQPKKIVREGLFLFDIENYVYPSIESWLNAFYSADYIVTDSFHGSVFSIIFNKPFIAIVNKDRGASRFESLFNLLGLSERLIYDDTLINEKILCLDMNYTEINQKLENLRVDSLKWLIESLKF